MKFMIVVYMLTNGGSLSDYQRISSMSDKLKITKTMTEAECNKKLKQLKRAVEKARMGKISGYCTGSDQ